MPKIKELTDDQIYDEVCEKHKFCKECPLNKVTFRHCRRKDYEEELAWLEIVKKDYEKFCNTEISDFKGGESDDIKRYEKD